MSPQVLAYDMKCISNRIFLRQACEPMATTALAGAAKSTNVRDWGLRMTGDYQLGFVLPCIYENNSSIYAHQHYGISVIISVTAQYSDTPATQRIVRWREVNSSMKSLKISVQKRKSLE